MNGSDQQEQVFVPGPAGRLEARLELPEAAGGGDAPIHHLGIISHPHPLHGGSMQSTICVRVARALRACGFATLRFNFRGVGQSAGKHDGQGAEQEDVRACLEFLRERCGDLPIWGAGYSFGARTTCDLAVDEERLERLVLIALPVRHYGPGRIASVRQPGLLVFGSEDEFGRAEDLPALDAHMRIHTIAGADHFFRGRTPRVEECVREYARTATQGAERGS